MYYTIEHEWIDYRGYTAHVGVCKIKLSGIKDVQSATFCERMSNIERGSVIATFYTNNKSLEIYMPVDGKIISFNDKLANNPSMILGEDQESIWIAKISPNAPYKREGLLQLHQYNSLNKKGYGTVNG